MAPSTLENFHVTRDTRGVATVSMDVPGRTYNVFTEEVFAELGRLVADLERDVTIRLVLFQSGKESGFHVGADLRTIAAIQSPEAADELHPHRAEGIGSDRAVADADGGRDSRAVSRRRVGVCPGLPLPAGARRRFRTSGTAGSQIGAVAWLGRNQSSAGLGGPDGRAQDALGGPKAFRPPSGRDRLGGRRLAARAVCRRRGTVCRRPIGRAIVPAAERRTARTAFASKRQLGRWLILRAARRRLERNGRRYPAVPAILGSRRARAASWPRRRLDARTGDVSRTAMQAPSAARAWNGSFDGRGPAQGSRGSRA